MGVGAGCTQQKSQLVRAEGAVCEGGETGVGGVCEER